MIKVSVVRDGKGFIQQIEVNGHAGYDEYGKDIVCAAISVTAYTAVGAIQKLAGLEEFFSIEDGYIHLSIPFSIPETKRQIVNIILETTVVGFKQVEYKYKKFVKVMDEEV